MTGASAAAAHGLGASDSVWFALTALLKDPVDPMTTIKRMCEKYGKAIRINLRDRRIVFLSDAPHFQHVMVKNIATYDKYFDGLHPVFGNAMITIDGALWQKVRVPQQAAFQPGRFEEYLPFFLKAIRAKSEKWDQFAADGTAVEMVEETWTMAADMVCQALFDRQMPFNPHVVFKYVKTYTNVQNHKSIRVGQQTATSAQVAADKEAADAIEAWQSIPEMVLNAPTIEDRVDTLLANMLAAEADADFTEFTREQVIDEMKQYLWAGTETTALTMAWCLYVLAQRPDIADKIRAEATALCGPHGEPSWEQAQQLTYTRRVIQETMRIYPPVWAFIREAAGEDEIDGVKIEKGDTIVLCSYAVHHSPKYWSDPDTFDPDRFSPEGLRARAKYSYLPFGAGKRACIGGAMSQLENALALAMLLRRFDVEYLGDVPAPISPTVTLTPRGGLHFKIHRRQ